VAGVNLLSPSIMRFKEEHGDSLLEAFLPRRSMYMMTCVALVLVRRATCHST
jgi:alkylated DNA repair protein alkB family protein 7